MPESGKKGNEKKWIQCDVYPQQRDINHVFTMKQYSLLGLICQIYGFGKRTVKKHMEMQVSHVKSNPSHWRSQCEATFYRIMLYHFTARYARGCDLSLTLEYGHKFSITLQMKVVKITKKKIAMCYGCFQFWRKKKAPPQSCWKMCDGWKLRKSIVVALLILRMSNTIPNVFDSELKMWYLTVLFQSL